MVASSERSQGSSFAEFLPQVLFGQKIKEAGGMVAVTFFASPDQLLQAIRQAAQMAGATHFRSPEAPPPTTHTPAQAHDQYGRLIDIIDLQDKPPARRELMSNFYRSLFKHLQSGDKDLATAVYQNTFTALGLGIGETAGYGLYERDRQQRAEIDQALSRLKKTINFVRRGDAGSDNTLGHLYSIDEAERVIWDLWQFLEVVEPDAIRFKLQGIPPENLRAPYATTHRNLD